MQELFRVKALFERFLPVDASFASGAWASSSTQPHQSCGAEIEEQRKEVRKEKNRQSAAATRARREAYTASLEGQVRVSTLHVMTFA